jgi:hypothetical protein
MWQPPHHRVGGIRHRTIAILGAPAFRRREQTLAGQMQSVRKTWQALAAHPLFVTGVAVWFGVVVALCVLAVRGALLERLVLASQLDLVLPMATPPLGLKARLLLALLFGLVAAWLGQKVGQALQRHAAAAALSPIWGNEPIHGAGHDDTPLTRNRSAKPVVQARRPFYASEELGDHRMAHSPVVPAAAPAPAPLTPPLAFPAAWAPPVAQPMASAPAATPAPAPSPSPSLYSLPTAGHAPTPPAVLESAPMLTETPAPAPVVLTAPVLAPIPSDQPAAALAPMPAVTSQTHLFGSDLPPLLASLDQALNWSAEPDHEAHADTLHPGWQTLVSPAADRPANTPPVPAAAVVAPKQAAPAVPTLDLTQSPLFEQAVQQEHPRAVAEALPPEPLRPEPLPAAVPAPEPLLSIVPTAAPKAEASRAEPAIIVPEEIAAPAPAPAPSTARPMLTAAERIAHAPLASLSLAELAERLAIAIQRREQAASQRAAAKAGTRQTEKQALQSQLQSRLEQLGPPFAPTAAPAPQAPVNIAATVAPAPAPAPAPAAASATEAEADAALVAALNKLLDIK